MAARPNIAEAESNGPIRFAWALMIRHFCPFLLMVCFSFQDGEVDFNLGFGFIGLHVLAEQVGHDFPAFLHEGLFGGTCQNCQPSRRSCVIAPEFGEGLDDGDGGAGGALAPLSMVRAYRDPFGEGFWRIFGMLTTSSCLL